MTIPGVTPFAGTLPVEAEPASFPARAEALFTWLTADAAPEIDAVATGINAALNDNGTVLDTAGNAIALTTNGGTLVTTAGTGNAYTITPAVAVAAYAAGQTFMIRPDRANTGAVTLQVGGLAATPVRKVASSGTGFVELAANDWNLGDVHIVGFTGAQFELLSIPLTNFTQKVEVISRQSLASAAANIDVTWDAALYDRIEIDVQNARPVNASTRLRAQTSGNAGVSYDAGASDYGFRMVERDLGTVESDGSSGATASVIDLTTTVGTAANEGGASFTITIRSAGISTTHTKLDWVGSFATGSASIETGVRGHARRSVASVVNGFRLQTSNGNIAAGAIVTAYGYRKT